MLYLEYMRNCSSKDKEENPENTNVLASKIVQEATKHDTREKESEDEKNPHAQALGRLVGLEVEKLRLLN